MQTEKRLQRLWNHWTLPNWKVRQRFSPALLKRLESLIAQSENQHFGQIRFVVETSLPAAAILKGMLPRDRAWQYFSQLGVWDTEYNSGVLLYIGCADHALEIVTDRGVSQKVDDAIWQDICAQLGQAFAREDFEQGFETALQQMTQVLVEHLPMTAVGSAKNELSNEVILK